MRMVLKHFLPEREFSWEELDEMSAKIAGKSTWPEQMLINLNHLGFDVAVVEGFDAKAFVAEGAAYLRRAFGQKTANWQIKNSDISQEQRIYQEFFKEGIPLDNRRPKLSEIQSRLDQGYLVVCVINAKRLARQPGYSAHFVVIYKVGDDSVEFHDPGLPPIENRYVSHSEFEAAWADPNEQAKNFIALKYAGAARV